MWPAITQRLAGGATAVVLPASFFPLSQGRHRGRIRAGGGAVSWRCLSPSSRSALVFFAARVLDEITEEASRYVMTGQAQQGERQPVRDSAPMSAPAMRSSELVSALFTCSNFMINVQNYSELCLGQYYDPIADADVQQSIRTAT